MARAGAIHRYLYNSCLIPYLWGDKLHTYLQWNSSPHARAELALNRVCSRQDPTASASMLLRTQRVVWFSALLNREPFYLVGVGWGLKTNDRRLERGCVALPRDDHRMSSEMIAMQEHAFFLRRPDADAIRRWWPPDSKTKHHN